MRPRSFVFLWAGILLIAILAGWMTRFSYRDNSSDAPERMNDFSVAQTGNDWENTEWKTPRQIADKAEYILIVKKSGQSTFLYHTILTPVEVLHVFKSNGEDFSEKPLYLYEPSFVDFERKRYYPHNSYNMMQDEAEYLVFLNPRVVPEGYTPTDTEKNSYLFTTNCALSKYLLNSSYQSDVLPDNADLKYEEIKSAEIVVYEKKDLDFYNRFKEELTAKFRR